MKQWVIQTDSHKQTVLDGRFFKTIGVTNRKGLDGKGTGNIVSNSSFARQVSAIVHIDRAVANEQRLQDRRTLLQRREADDKNREAEAHDNRF